MLKEAKYYARMAFHFARYLQQAPIANARELLQHTLAHREDNFLELMLTGVYASPANPCGELLRLAGCQYGDLVALVRRHGLEPALQHLHAAGVYLTHAEVKGAPIRRHGQTIPNDPAATRHPRPDAGIESISGGSRSRGTATPSSNAYRRYREEYETIVRKEIGAEDRVTGSLHAILPSPASLMFCAAEARRGRPVARWFASGGAGRDAGYYRAITGLLVTEGRLIGMRMPYPTYLTDDDFSPVVAWISASKRHGRPVLIRGNASASTRVCAAARESGTDISDTIFITSGEAISDAKRNLMDEVNVRGHARYVISEIGTIGIACSHLRGNSVHWFSDSSAIIVHRRFAPYADVEVDSLLFTSIHPLASRIFINAEMEDQARLVPAQCDCEFSRLGFTTILEDIQSFGKLTGHGLTLAGTDMVSLLEERLPARFGGAPGDYQLVEFETARQAEVHLRISPRVPAIDPALVHDFFLGEVQRLYGGALSRRTWTQTSSLIAEVAEPFRTRTGKVLPLHLPAVGESRVS